MRAATAVVVTLKVSEEPLVTVAFGPGQVPEVLRQVTAGPFTGRL